ncbi:MAG TPA: PIG-L family deacetylase [Acidimicrobiales bacterium]|nr:PIG-L family deacetylase [Acidimicrobiales bacterium]
MATLVCFHAHPDDESITTGGTIARAVAEGHRAVLVVATRGEHGEVPEDLAEGETLADRRVAETMRSAAVLGIARVEFLGYTDSGMDGWEQNHEPNCFWQAPVDEAAERLAALLREEDADVLTVYDSHGNYGHPDHIQVHRVGHRAAELAGTPSVYEATMNRDAVQRLVEMARELAPELDIEPPEMPEEVEFGEPESAITTAVDVRAYIAQKRDSITMHASQVTDSSFFLRMPPDVFAQAFSTEWFIRKGAPPGIHEDKLAGL